VTDQLDYILTADNRPYRGAAVAADRTLSVAVADLHEPGEEIVVSVGYESARAFEVVAFDELGATAGRRSVRYPAAKDSDGPRLGTARLDPLPPGVYIIVVRAPGDPHGRDVAPVGSTTMVIG